VTVTRRDLQLMVVAGLEGAPVEHLVH
jgi:hypothetical protein